MRQVQKDILHTATSRFVHSSSQRFLTVLLKRNTSHYAADCLLAFRDFLNVEVQGANFQLAAGTVHYGESPATGHYCSFRKTTDGHLLYTNDSIALFVDFAHIQAAVPYLLFFLRS